MLQIRTSINQAGLFVEARQIPSEPWRTVQLTRFTERSRPGFGKARFVFIDPAKDESDYLDAIRARGIEFTHVRPTYDENGSLTIA